jgi:uncharacterized protein (UPF0218 family)
MFVYRMPEDLRERLARPHLYNPTVLFIEGPREYVAFTLRTLLYSFLNVVYVVGDFTCETFLQYIGTPHLCVIDGTIMRKRSENLYITKSFEHVFSCVNPMSTISVDCIKKLQEALKHYKSLVIVKGEEDLLPLALLLLLPTGYIVFGIPKKGVALIDVSSYNRSEAVNIFSQFIPSAIGNS